MFCYCYFIKDSTLAKLNVQQWVHYNDDKILYVSFNEYEDYLSVKTIMIHYSYKYILQYRKTHAFYFMKQMQVK